MFWTIDCHLYLNLDFSLIKKKENAFRRFLKVRQIEWEDLVFSENAFTFYADKANYEKIKYHTKVFLIDHIEEEFKIDFLKNEKDLNIFEEFTLSPLKLSALKDVELYWQD